MNLATHSRALRLLTRCNQLKVPDSYYFGYLISTPDPPPRCPCKCSQYPLPFTGGSWGIDSMTSTAEPFDEGLEAWHNNLIYPLICRREIPRTTPPAKINRDNEVLTFPLDPIMTAASPWKPTPRVRLNSSL
jgi:hypothetical protein